LHSIGFSVTIAQEQNRKREGLADGDE